MILKPLTQTTVQHVFLTKIYFRLASNTSQIYHIPVDFKERLARNNKTALTLLKSLS